MYRVFDIRVDSDLLLPGLPRVSSKDRDWHVSMTSVPIDESGYEWLHEWAAPDGDEPGPVMACARSDQKYLLRFPDLADFEIDFEARRIQSSADADGQESSLAHLLLDQVLPRILSHLGRPVFHASSILMSDGRAIAFLGATGAGKSTLASAFYRAGSAVLSDDCLLLEVEQNNGRLRATAPYPSLRLWQDSINHLFTDPKQFSEVAHFTDKRQCFPNAGPTGDDVCSAPIAALFILGEPREGLQPGSIHIEPASGRATIMTLLESLFALDIRDRDFVKRQFSWAGELSRSGTAVFKLDFPREYPRLDDVLTKIMQKLDSR